MAEAPRCRGKRGEKRGEERRVAETQVKASQLLSTEHQHYTFAAATVETDQRVAWAGN
jgi:hypothetical protein